jgi:hypothetical protein
MPLTTVRQEAANRFQEVQTFLSEIKTQEASFGTQPSMELNTQKGLFIVLLYGAFEYSITRSITEMSALINIRKVRYEHIHNRLYPLALDPQLTSISMVGRENKWHRRIELFRKQFSSETAIIYEGAILPDMENIWAATIQKIFDIYGISSPSLYDPRVKQYIDEVVDKRNAVAHGRESAATIGQAYTGGMLQSLADEINRQAQFIFSAFENVIMTKGFIDPAHQAAY